MSAKVTKTYACDFETTVYDGQEYTEVWSAAMVELYQDDVTVLHSIDSMFKFFYSKGCNIVAYFHNLKFDGTFIVSYLLENGFKQSYITLPVKDEEKTRMKWTRNMYNNEFQYMISTKGQWYTIKVKKYNKIIEFRDSLKLFPFTLREVGEAFKTKHRKLDMEYKGLRYAGCEISPEEMEYIKNDVLVLKEALEYMFDQGHKRLTIGSNCLQEFKTIIGGEQIYQAMYPNLYQYGIGKEYGYDTAGDYILKSYRGGWCYLVEEKANKLFHNGVTADVNSLYPSMMHSESGNVFPYGHPTFWKGDYIPEEARSENRYYFIRVRTRFYLRSGYLPFIQIKGDWRYSPTKCLRTSDVYSYSDGKYYRYIEDENGNQIPTTVTLTLTMTDWELMKEHYHLVDTEILDGCWFEARAGQFDEYIDKYKEIKLTSKGAMRTLAKLFLNNLYGKFASTPDSSFKVIFLKDDKSITFVDQRESEKKPGYIPIGSAVTSYARNFTIRAAQKNYHGADKPGFIYADTDSIHCDLQPDEVKGVTVHPVNFCCWKLEKSWDDAIFARQKTYIEHIVAEDLEPVEKPYYNITCAGMPDKCKNLLNESLTQPDPNVKHTEEELEFVNVHRTLEDFKEGLVVPGKLIPKRIRGGTILVETTYEMR